VGLPADQVGHNGVDLGGRHLGGHELIPDQLVESELVMGDLGFDLLRWQIKMRRPDRFVGILGFVAVFELRGALGR
jgi:hypothetical protein